MKRIMTAGFLCARLAAILLAFISAGIFLVVVGATLPASNWDIIGFLQGSAFLLPPIVILAAITGYLCGFVFGALSVSVRFKGMWYAASVVAGLLFHMIATSVVWVLPSRNPKDTYVSVLLELGWFAVVPIAVGLVMATELARFRRTGQAHTQFLNKWASRIDELDSR